MRLSKGNLYITAFLIFLIWPVIVDAKALSDMPSTQHPYYWKGMIASLPREMMPEAAFEERELPDTAASIIFKNAVSSFKEKSYQKSIEQLKEITVRFPKEDITQFAYYLMGDCYSKMAQAGDEELLKEAVSAYLQAVMTYPVSEEAPRGLYQAGRGLFLQGFYYEAIAQMNRISSSYPKSSYVQKGMVAKGIIYFSQKKYRLSESVLLKVVNSDAASDLEKGLGTLWLANSFHMEGGYAKARELYKAVEKAWPEHLEGSRLFILLMGENLLILGDYEDSRKLFGIYVKRYPDSVAVPAVILRTGDALRSEGKRGDAFKMYSTVILQFPAVDVAIIGKARIAEIEIEKGNAASAIPVLGEMIALKGDMAREAALIIVEALKKAGISSEAARGYRTILDNFGETVEADLKGKMAESLRDVVAVSYDNKDYLAVLKTYHEDPKLLNKRIREPQFIRMIADSYMEVGLPSSAASVYEELLSSRDMRDSKALSGPYLEETLFRAAEAHMKAGNSEEAGKVIKRLLAEFPKSRFKDKVSKISGETKVIGKEDGAAGGYINIAKKSLEGKRFKEAAEYYRKVISLKEPSLLAAAYIGLGDAYFGMERYRDAINAFETGKVAGGEMGSWAGYRIGESYLNLKDIEKAQMIFQAVAKEDKGVYGKMAAEELKRAEMGVKNPARVDWNTWVSKPVGTVHLEKEKNERRRVD